MTRLRSDIVYGVTCPRCPIGYRRLQRAVRTLTQEDFSFDVVRQPFELAPDMPADGGEILPAQAVPTFMVDGKPLLQRTHFDALPWRFVGVGYGRR